MHGALEKRCGPGDAEAGRHGTLEFWRRTAGVETLASRGLEARRRRGDTEAWMYGALEARCRCMARRYRGIEISRSGGAVQACRLGDMEVGNSRDALRVTWRYGGLKARCRRGETNGDLEVWRLGTGVATWRNEVWGSASALWRSDVRYGSMEPWRCTAGV